MNRAYPDASTRTAITVAIMAATVMSALDSTIANVALPHMRGSVSASQEEITWVLTSYIVAAAIFTPLTGWLARRFGAKRVILASIVGFTAASALCGIATGLGELVVFRLMQGMFGAALIPISQAILLDINPPDRHGPAMAVWGMGAMLGPIVGPALGGWLTEELNWRWVFYINVPVGAFAFIGLSSSLRETDSDAAAHLDMFGFGLLALAISALQMMLDRGQQQGWFDSTEICIEAAAAGTLFFMFVVHSITARRSFVDLAIFKDRNFAFGSLLGFFIGLVVFAVLALLPSMLQGLLGLPALQAGLVTAPRGIGTLISMWIVGQLINRVDPRALILTGLALSAYSLERMSHFTLAMDTNLAMTSGFIQGLGTGLIFVPMSTLGFATLAAKYRSEGAAMYNLVRNIGAAVGISVLQSATIRSSAAARAHLAEQVHTGAPALALRAPDFDPGAAFDVARLGRELARQAAMAANVSGYRTLMVMTIAIAPLVLLMRPPPRERADGAAPLVHAD